MRVTAIETVVDKRSPVFGNGSINSIGGTSSSSTSNSAASNGIRKSSLSKRAVDRDSTIRRFQETNKDATYSNDFELDDIDLSYSRFSQLSVSSFKSGDENSLGNRSGNSKTEQNSEERDRPNEKLKMSSIEETRFDDSPFIEKVIDQLGSDSHIRFYMNEREVSPIRARKLRSNNELRNSAKIDKDQKLDDSKPFKEKIEDVKDHSPLKGALSNDNQDRKELHVQKYTQIEQSEDTKLPLHGEQQNNQKLPLNNATPIRPRHLRNPSVKVSLTPAQRFEKRPGTRSFNALENFKFSTLVGKGAFANVYKGINLKTHSVVAIKQILLDRDQDVMELMGEIDLLKILKHPNIVKYHGFVKTSTSLNIFLEFCSGGSLRQMYKRLGHGISEPQIIKFVQSILFGLNYLHEQGVVHRDVKAANVLVNENGDIKLADFGVASKVNSQHDTVVGTPNWMAPETVLGGEGLCTASDIWSLGATIIELFTMNPPYHDLNPMATLHAIGTDEHPPLPKNVSSFAKDFLLECFQKQPSLRISAKLLLKHKWLQDTTQRTRLSKPSMELKLMKSEENWEKDLDVHKLGNLVTANINPGAPDRIEIKDLDEEFKTMVFQPKYTKTELLTKFSEVDDALEIDTTGVFTINNLDKANISTAELVQEEEEESDPFLNIDIENFDTNELEIQSKMEYLVGKFTGRVALCHSGNEEVLNSLIKVTGRMLHMVKKYPVSQQVLIKEHGLLSLLELLDSAVEFPSFQRLWYHILAILNNLFGSNLSIFENFCLIGGIPSVTQFRVPSNELNVRLQVVIFLSHFNKSDRALSMLIACGGLKVVSKFVEEDFDSTPTFPLVSIECIHNILRKDLTRSKSDLCRILSKYGVIFWFIVLLNRLTKPVVGQVPVSQEQIQLTIDRIMDILKYFSQSETRVKLNIAQVDLFKLLIKIYNSGALQFQHRLIILKFFKAMSCISEVLKTLYQAEILEFLLLVLSTHPPSSEHYKEVINVVCPTLYNCCYLNHSKEVEVVRMGAVPHLKNLSMINLPFRQFVLPILCELVHCDGQVRAALAKNDILSVYFNLLLDPYWQSNALDSILSWYQQEPEYVKLSTPKAMACLIGGFTLTKVSNLESTLDNYLKLININKAVGKQMCKDAIFDNILIKLNVYMKNPVVQLTLLRILKVLISYADEELPSQNVYTVLHSLKSRHGSVLVDELASEITSYL